MLNSISSHEIEITHDIGSAFADSLEALRQLFGAAEGMCMKKKYKHATNVVRDSNQPS